MAHGSFVNGHPGNGEGGEQPRQPQTSLLCSMAVCDQRSRQGREYQHCGGEEVSERVLIGQIKQKACSGQRSARQAGDNVLGR